MHFVAVVLIHEFPTDKHSKRPLVSMQISFDVVAPSRCCREMCKTFVTNGGEVLATVRAQLYKDCYGTAMKTQCAVDKARAATI